MNTLDRFEVGQRVICIGRVYGDWQHDECEEGTVCYVDDEVVAVEFVLPDEVSLKAFGETGQTDIANAYFEDADGPWEVFAILEED